MNEAHILKNFYASYASPSLFERLSKLTSIFKEFYGSRVTKFLHYQLEKHSWNPHKLLIWPWEMIMVREHTSGDSGGGEDFNKVTRWVKYSNSTPFLHTPKTPHRLASFPPASLKHFTTTTPHHNWKSMSQVTWGEWREAGGSEVRHGIALPLNNTLR